MLPPLPKKMLFGTRLLRKSLARVYIVEEFKNRKQPSTSGLRLINSLESGKNMLAFGQRDWRYIFAGIIKFGPHF